MTRPEIARRVERTEEDLTAIFGTVLDIKDTVDRHTEALAVHGRELTAIRETELLAIKETVDRHTETLAVHGRELIAIREIELPAIKDAVGRHTEALAVHGRELATIKDTQAQHGELLAEILRRLEIR